MKKRSLLALAAILVALGATLSGDATAGPHAVLKLTPGGGGMFLVGKPPGAIRAPVRVTLGLSRGGLRHVRLFGLHPGGVVFAGVKAKPFFRFKGPGVDVKIGPGRGHGPKIRGPKGGKFRF